MLYPQENEFREVRDLSGIWHFRQDVKGEGLEELWYLSPLERHIHMPVPSSYNDLTQDPALRDHVGDVWYERDFFLPDQWKNSRLFLRFGSVTHHCQVWINGILVTEHKGGFLPFQIDVTEFVFYRRANRLTVRVNNKLDWTCLPPGEVKDGRQHIYHDFYNYAGIHRPVHLLAVPMANHITAIRIKTDVVDGKGLIQYEFDTAVPAAQVESRLFNRDGDPILAGKHRDGVFVVPNPSLWEPGNPYLYNLQFNLLDADGRIFDRYRLTAGIRTVKAEKDRFLLNGKPFYFRGFGMHEDADIRGKGYDPVLLVKNFNLLKWMNANSVRTSHYPYSEEFLQLADEEGIVVIDEMPAVGFNFWNESETVFTKGRADEQTLAHHLQTARDLVQRDMNHPSVAMWSVGNEPAAHEDGCDVYFAQVIDAVRKLDPTRPITLVLTSAPDRSPVAARCDVICLNKYFGWYVDTGDLSKIGERLKAELLAWRKRFGKPVFLTEFGADTLPGFHSDPAALFSEEFQVEFLKEYHKVFDELDFIVGEHVWVFADFATKQELRRPGGNRKGVLTRQRQPKAAAFALKERWGKMSGGSGKP
jgi:beta-glucuronidase